MNECRCNELKTLHGREGQEYINSHLVEIADDPKKWETLYKCPKTGAYWKEYFPNAEAHGGGAPEYIRISLKQAKEEFKFD